MLLSPLYLNNNKVTDDIFVLHIYIKYQQ